MDVARLTVVITGLALAGRAAAQPLPLPPPTATEPPAETPATIPIVPIALAYTPLGNEVGLQVEPWTDAGPTLAGTSAGLVDYFTVAPAPIVIAPGESFALERLAIVAPSLDGTPVLHAPLKLSLEAPEGVIDVAAAVESQRLVGLAPGIGRLWIESLLRRGTGTGEHFRLPVVILVR